MIFILIINIEFKNNEDMKYFINKFLVLQKYCLDKEKNFLLQYEYAISDKNKNKIVIIEKYINKKSYLNIHRKSIPFLNFKENIKNLNLIINGESYIN
jgi:quinol monooxygenase YgiN